ncbi:hypothetical protein [Promicromonospora sp. NPDC050249]|uniref:hypothetical protein n=1 Tax=Promicromonospora sp. NPDC050249 TaxID=3154743 RepID=UPI0033D02EB5
MADGTENQVSDGSSADSPQGPHAPYLEADTGRVARIVAALRKAHAEQAAAGSTTDTATDTAEPADASAPRRETSGVKPTKPAVPTLRWNPGARYRASRLADHPVADAPQVAQVPAPPAPVPGPPAPVPAPPGPPALPAAGPVPAPPALAGRLFRGPARRTAVFEREIWYPVTRSSHVPRDVSEALVAAVERYRKGSISTSGLVRAIGRAHAA